MRSKSWRPRRRTSSSKSNSRMLTQASCLPQRWFRLHLLRKARALHSLATSWWCQWSATQDSQCGSSCRLRMLTLRKMLSGARLWLNNWIILLIALNSSRDSMLELLQWLELDLWLPCLLVYFSADLFKLRFQTAQLCLDCNYVMLLMLESANLFSYAGFCKDGVRYHVFPPIPRSCKFFYDSYISELLKCFLKLLGSD